ncbi:MAG TPA: hypothetical protein VK966_02210 [Longimicrobiales bacterium]|nr:hypothetical protein [Longimicrobiales bacterium]
MRTERSPLVTGAVGGALAATVVVVFFFLEDLLQGRLMETPEFLAQVVFGQDTVGTGVLVIYTLLHYGLFMAVGAGVAWFLDRSRLPATLFLGLVVGFLLFDVVFYASIWLRGVDVVEVLGWPSFLAGNLLAGLALFWYLRRSGAPRPRSWGDVLHEHQGIREGLMAGLIGAATVAVWFLAVDAVMGRVFFTPAALGSALFGGAGGPAAVDVTVANVLGYSLLHVAAFLATGLVFAAIITQSERYPSLLLALALLFVTFETLAIGLLVILAAWLLEVIPAWTIAVANLIAAGAMGFYLWRKHPELSGKLRMAERRDLGGEPTGPVPPLHRAGPHVR